MKIFMTGGTGFVGSYLTRRFTAEGHEVGILTRSVGAGRTLPRGAVFIEGNPTTPGPWQEQVTTYDAVINLAGASIFNVWTAKNRRSIIDSRVMTTRNVTAALAKPGGSTTTLISASAVGYYGSHTGDATLDEDSPPGRDFLSEVGVRWEAEAMKAEQHGVRVAIARFGVVLGRNGGALDKMLPFFKKCLGSSLGSGKQWFPWIHEQDVYNIMAFLLEHQLSGPFNCTAPEPVTNKDLSRTLAAVLGCPLIMPAVPGFILKAALGDFADVVLKGQRALPARLLAAGFDFEFSTLLKALSDLTQPG